MNELDWHKFHINIAKQYASLSKDPRLKVGAILVPHDFSKIYSVGYNGWEKGGTNQPDSDELGKSGAVHAEMNTLIKACVPAENCYLYCSHSCCRVCARGIVNFGKITHFVYEVEYRDTSGLDILRNSGIQVLKV